MFPLDDENFSNISLNQYKRFSLKPFVIKNFSKVESFNHL